MNEKFCTENYTSYQHQCLKQVANVNDSHAYYSYTNFPLNTMSPTTNFSDVYNLSSQNFSFQQSNNSITVQQEQSDMFIWESRLIPDVERSVRVPDKIEMIDISTKDLSPASYYSNTDLIISDPFKNSRKDMQSLNKFETECCYNQNNYRQKNSSYESCAQEKLDKYHNVQNQSKDFITRNCNYSDMLHENSMLCNTKTASNQVASDYMYNYYENKFMGNQPFTQNDDYSGSVISIEAPFASAINSIIDQQADGSNEESDIIVEESDEEITDYSEDLEKRLALKTNKCFICNIIYKPLGTQFYILTAENPLTMSSQKPVVEKFMNIIGKISITGNYLCSECLGLINNIDHLQLKLEKYKSDIAEKFKRTCSENKAKYEKRSSTQKVSYINKFPKYRCKLCKKILCLKKYCSYHIMRHRNRGYLCDLCGKIYSNKKMFALHHVQHKRKFCTKIKAFKCLNCNHIFRTKSNQKEHENFCLGLLPFKCKHQHCDKKFPSATKLKNHIKLKHDKKFVVICSICNIGFIKMSDYKSHVISHSTDKKYSCSNCHKNYKTLSNLNFHMKSHNDILPFSCNICKKGFMRKEYLESHINNHNSIKNFNCSSCDKTFVSQKNLDAHLKYHEGTVKRNTCNICGKTLTTGFEEHLRIHNNLREFECELCDMKFNTKGTLSKHVKKKHA